MSDVLPQLDPSSLVPALNPTLVVDGAGLLQVSDFLKRKNVFGKDYETNIVESFYTRRARTLQIGDRDEQYIIDLLAFAETPERLYADQGNYRVGSSLLPVVETMRPAFESNSHLKLCHGAEFEYMVSKWCLGMRPWHVYCTQITEKVLLNGLHNFMATDVWGLENLIGRYCKVQIDKSAQTSFDLCTPITTTQIVYCALDVRLLFPIKSGQDKKVIKSKLTRVVEIENDFIPAVGDMKLNGLKLHEGDWRNLITSNKEELKSVITQMDEVFIPIVGQKPKQADPEESARLQAIWKSFDNDSPEEIEIKEQIKAAPTDEKPALREKRVALEVSRKLKKAAARSAYMAIASGLTKTAMKEYAKMEGEAYINYNGTGQLRDALLAGKFGFTKTNLPNTNDKTLEKHAEKPVIKLIRKYRSLGKLIGTYGERWLSLNTEKVNDKGDRGYTDSNTGRIHSSIHQLGAETGRLSSSGPNVHNLPQDDRYRACFVARDGYKVITIDYNGQELRILTEYSGERAWIDAFSKGWDVHSVCAEILYGAEWKKAAVHEAYEEYSAKKKKNVTIPRCAYYYKDTDIAKKGATPVFEDHQKCECPEHKTMRGWLKNINFGIAYGKGAFALAADLEISTDDAEALLTRYKKTFPVLWSYLENSGEQGYYNLESRTMSGRRRLYRKVEWEQARLSAKEKFSAQMKKEGRTEPTQKEITKQYKGIINGIKRQGMNTPVQGTGADMVKVAVGCGFDENGKPFGWHLMEPEFGALLLNLVHDETVSEAPDQPDTYISPFYKGAVIEQGNVQKAYDCVADCMVRAGEEFIKKIPVVVEGHIAERWMK
jgi:DNA polymerase I-like protein with 3'-5' exonuclease and polymerase domains